MLFLNSWLFCVCCTKCSLTESQVAPCCFPAHHGVNCISSALLLFPLLSLFMLLPLPEEHPQSPPGPLFPVLNEFFMNNHSNNNALENDQEKHFDNQCSSKHHAKTPKNSKWWSSIDSTSTASLGMNENIFHGTDK